MNEYGFYLGSLSGSEVIAISADRLFRSAIDPSMSAFAFFTREKGT